MPPIHLLDLVWLDARTEPREDSLDAQAAEEAQIPVLFCVQLLQGIGIEVVVVVVAYAYGIDLGKLVDGAWRRREAYGPNHAVGPYTVAPDRVKQYPHASSTSLSGCCFDQETRVSYPRSLQAVCGMAEIRFAHFYQAKAIGRNWDEVIWCTEACAQGGYYAIVLV